MHIDDCNHFITGFGIASHLGVLSNTATVGVAKTLMQVDGIAKNEEFAAKVN